MSLLVYAGVVALVGQLLLSRLTRSGTAPRLGVVMWQVAALSVVGSWVLGALALDGPVPLHDLAHFFASRLDAVNQLSEAPGIGWLQAVGVIVATGIIARAAWCLAVDSFLASRRRIHHARATRLVGRPLPHDDAVVIEHGVAMAYCIPGRARQVVVTRGALDSLSDSQLSAVLAHERAHLAGRHHLALAPLRALSRAFPAVPLLSSAAREVARLLEMCADDAAARRHGAAAVSGALRALSTRPTPDGTLGASGARAAERIARLDAQVNARRGWASGVLSAAVVLLITGPVIALAAPLLLAAASRSGYCPVPLPV